MRSLATTATVEEFEKAKAALETMPSVGNDDKLRLYGLFKASTAGPCNTEQPGMLDFVGRAKWNAWNGVGDITVEEARAKYAEACAELLGTNDFDAVLGGGSSAAAEAPAAAEPGTYATLAVTHEDGVCRVAMNRPSKKNAINLQMYEEIQRAMSEAAADDGTRAFLLTGTGDYYSSGNDLSNFTENMPPEGPKKLAADAAAVLEQFVNAFIDFPKPLIAAVNGPAVGIPVTLLGLVDVAYASERATFHTPFTALGQAPEACSSVMFPRMMGPQAANEVLLMGRKLTAIEAKERGIVADVFEDASLHTEAMKRAKTFASLPPQSMVMSKGIVRAGMGKEALKEVNKKECELLEGRWVSDECMAAIMKFFERK